MRLDCVVIVRGEAELLDCETDQPVTDTALLRRLDGLGADYDLAQYIAPGSALHGLRLVGGDLRLRYDHVLNRLFAESRYQVDQRLEARELELVLHYTRGQWSDGVGESFDPCHKAGLSGNVVSLRWENALTATLQSSGESLVTVIAPLVTRC